MSYMVSGAGAVFAGTAVTLDSENNVLPVAGASQAPDVRSSPDEPGLGQLEWIYAPEVDESETVSFSSRSFSADSTAGITGEVETPFGSRDWEWIDEPYRPEEAVRDGLDEPSDAVQKIYEGTAAVPGYRLEDHNGKSYLVPDYHEMIWVGEKAYAIRFGYVISEDVSEGATNNTIKVWVVAFDQTRWNALTNGGAGGGTDPGTGSGGITKVTGLLGVIGEPVFELLRIAYEGVSKQSMVYDGGPITGANPTEDAKRQTVKSFVEKVNNTIREVYSAACGKIAKTIRGS